MNRDTIRAIKVLKNGTLTSDNCRQWDNCFEDGNGDKVVKELSELVKNDAGIAQLVLRYSNFMPSAILKNIPQEPKPSSNKVIFMMKNAFDGIKYSFEWADRVNRIIERESKKDIIQIKINGVIISGLSDLKQFLLSSSKNDISKSEIYIESKLTKLDIETFNMVKNMCMGS